MAAIEISPSSTGGGGTTSPAGVDTNVQYNDNGVFGGNNEFNFDGSTVGIGTPVGAKKLTVFDAPEQCIATFGNDTTGAGITFTDSTTTDDESVGVGAFGDLLCLRGGGNTGGTIQLSNSTIDCQSNELVNFIPRSLNVTTNLNITSANFTTYLSAIIKVTGAITITVDNTVVDDFNVSIIQMDANQCTFAAGGTLTLQNRQGHTQTAGQWATTTLYVTGTNLILAGDTA
jgi:hypothetical protein